MEITESLVIKLRDTVDKGLCSGIGIPVPGKMCVEAAVCYALGLPHGDNPPCVGMSVRNFKVALNDQFWSSDQARANGMRKLAVAQLGSNSIDQVKFTTNITLDLIREIIPELFDLLNIKGAEKCKEVKTLKEGWHAAYAAAYATSDNATAAYASNYAAEAANYAAKAANGAANYAAEAAYYAASYAANAANYTAYAAYAANGAANAARYTTKNKDYFLIKMAEIGLRALKNSPGYKFLYLLD